MICILSEAAAILGVLDLAGFRIFSLPQPGGGYNEAFQAIMAEKTMNLRGLKCPLPVLRLRKMMLSMESGDLVVAECTDPLTAIDIPHLLRQTGDTLESKTEAGGVLSFRVRKK
jgi:tRNA 2-thiouridine synthesizing protein A